MNRINCWALGLGVERGVKHGFLRGQKREGRRTGIGGTVEKRKKGPPFTNTKKKKIVVGGGGFGRERLISVRG